MPIVSIMVFPGHICSLILKKDEFLFSTITEIFITGTSAMLISTLIAITKYMQLSCRQAFANLLLKRLH